MASLWLFSEMTGVADDAPPVPVNVSIPMPCFPPPLPAPVLPRLPGPMLLV